MEQARRIARRKRLLASIVSAALVVGVVGAGSSAALAEAPNEAPVTQTENPTGETEPTDPGNTGGDENPGTGETANPDETPRPETPAPEVPSGEDPAAPTPENDQPLQVLSGETAEAAASPEANTIAPAAEPYATGTCPAISAQEYSFGKGNTYGISDAREGTVLGYNGVPTDLGTSNQHFAYFPLPTTTTTPTVKTDYAETLTYSKYVDGTTGTFGLSIDKNGTVGSWGGNKYGQLGRESAIGSQSVNARGTVDTLPTNESYVQVSAGGSHAIALSASGNVYAWGLNDKGQLGQGTTDSTAGANHYAARVKLPAGTKIMQISAGMEYSLAVDTKGQVWGWGRGADNSLANAGGPNPTIITGLPKAQFVTAGYHHSGAITADGDLYMWGLNANGQLGTNNTSVAIQKVAGPAGLKWKHASAGNASTWAVTTSGALYAWGYNGHFQLGISDGLDKKIPTDTGLTGIVQVSGNNYVGAAVSSDGAVRVAGKNARLQLGLTGGESIINKNWGYLSFGGTYKAKQVAVGINAIGAKGTGTASFAAVHQVDHAVGWGFGYQVGHGANSNVPTPNYLTITGSPTAVSPSPEGETTVIDTSGLITFGNPQTESQSISGWQYAKNTQVVTVGSTKYLRGDVPAHVAGSSPVYLKWNAGPNTSWQLKGCYKYTIALKTGSTPNPSPHDGTVDVTAGFYDPQEAPYAGSALADISIPALSGSPAPLTLVSGSAVTSLPLSGTAAGKVKLAVPNPAANNGANKWKYPTTATARVVTPTAGNLVVSRNTPAGDVQFVKDGVVDPDPDPDPDPEYTCDVEPEWVNKEKVSGNVLGYDSAARKDDYIKVPVPTSAGIVKVSLGATAPAKQFEADPNNRPFGTDSMLYVQRSSGAHALYLDKDGNVWGTGKNNLGQVGNGSTANVSTPVLVLGPGATGNAKTAKIKDIAAGADHSIALTENGEIYQWGSSASLGKVAIASATAISSPEKSTSPIKFTEIDAGTNFSAAIAGGNIISNQSSNGLVYVWGQNNKYQLGEGGTSGATMKAAPYPVQGSLAGKTVTQLSVGSEYIMAVVAGAPNDLLYMWGGNTAGVMPGTRAGAADAVRIGSPTLNNGVSGKIKQIEAGDKNAYAVTTTGALYAWGATGWGAALMTHVWPNTLNSDSLQTTPRIGNGTSGIKFTGVYSGHSIVYMTTESGDVYAAGNNRRPNGSVLYGDLGIDQSAWDTPEPNVPTKVPALSGKGVTDIQAGWTGTQYAYPVVGLAVIATTTDGLYGWGGNRAGEMGPAITSDTESVASPKPLNIGIGQKITSGTVYFGDPAQGIGFAKSIPVSVDQSNIVTENGKDYFVVQIPKHVVGQVEVHTDWGAVGKPKMIGCYNYMLSLKIWPFKYPEEAGGTVTVTAQVGAGEESLTGNARIDIFIPNLGTGATNELRLVAGQSLTGLTITGGIATTQVKLRDPFPNPTELNGDWKYPDDAIAWIPTKSPVSSLANDPTAQVVSNKAKDNPYSIPEVWFTPKDEGVDVYLWKTGESTTSRVVGMSGSKWQIYGNNTATSPNSPDKTKTVAGFDMEIPNPNTGNPEREKGWFTAKLKPGIYWLVETKAPAGFQLMATPLQFQVFSDGSMRVLIGQSGYTTVTSDWKPTAYNYDTLVVRDPGATPLPESGSAPWWWISVAGLLLLGVSVVLVVRRFFPGRLSLSLVAKPDPRHAA
ncbi:hypothetical protein G7068_05095 [Leucobacter viscericola]|uniref:Uncharacterized protein n=1 Tax=Leucobacter viscericola TaxID=2714935 RepID=A0A6G7XDI4_9MICO|nr:SpaA isopeptide-forming pilin-related protein [Leucobacter viscericola]QIK62654.1 hypothetical protein G7068_05095 [Leucobacter viscericola]